MSETVFAHRGCAGQYPENTLLAIREAAPHVDAFEIDVRPCGSGEIVVFHDVELDRLTGATGRVDDTSLAELRTLEILDSGETIPTLGELLNTVPDSHPVNVEFKTAGVAEEVRSICEASENTILYSSFLPDALRELRRAGPDAAIGVLCHETPDRAIQLATSLDATAIHPSIALCTETDVIGDAHDQGYDVNAWTAADAEDVRTLRRANVDGIITDRWDVI